MSELNQQILEEILAGLGSRTIISTIGVYNNGDRVSNGVHRDDLFTHIEYNFTYRFGRALFVEGRCLNHGYLSPERIRELETEFQAHPDLPRTVTRPYR